MASGAPAATSPASASPASSTQARRPSAVHIQSEECHMLLSYENALTPIADTLSKRRPLHIRAMPGLHDCGACCLDACRSLVLMMTDVCCCMVLQA